MSRQISEERKIAYYIGNVIVVVGALLFFSVFFTAAMSMGESSSSFFSNPTASMDRSSAMMQSIAFRAFGGFVLMIIGKSISNIGAKGLAGSGVILDPEQARQELEPHSRMAGGIIKDTLEEANINLSGNNSGHAEKIIMVKCQSCKKLNEEDAKYCKECGKEM